LLTGSTSQVEATLDTGMTQISNKNIPEYFEDFRTQYNCSIYKKKNTYRLALYKCQMKRKNSLFKY